MLKGKIAIVTGSTSGIGLGIARELVTRGADVVLNGFGDAGEIEAIRSHIERDHGVRVVYDGAGMSKGDAVRGPDHRHRNVRRWTMSISSSNRKKKSGIGTSPGRSENRLMPNTATDCLLVPARSNAVQEDLNGRTDRLLRFFIRRRPAESENDLQMKVVADHAYKVPGQSQAVVRPNFPSLIGGFKYLGEPGRGAARSLFVKRLHKIGKAIGLGDGNSVNADQGGRHVNTHQMLTKRRQRRPQVVAFDPLDHQRRKHFVCTFLDDGGEQALLVAELIVDVALRPTGALDDRVDACRRVALFEKDLGGSSKKRFSATVRPPCLCCSHSHSSIPTHPLTGNDRYHRSQW
jgi:hypothetical protein